MQSAEELPERINKTQIHHNRTLHDIVAIDNDKVLPNAERNVCTRRDTLRHLHRCCGTDGNDTPERIQSVSDRFEYAGYKRLRAVGTATHLQCGQFKDHSDYCNNRFGQLQQRGTFRTWIFRLPFKPFSISELMEVSDKCAMKGKQNESLISPPYCLTAMNPSCWIN